MSKHQDLMTAAYARWTDHSLTKEAFHDMLSAEERFAVHTGNLNYQVENGGWMQWFDNGYGTEEVVAYLKRQLPALGDVGLKVLALVKKATKVRADVEFVDDEDYAEAVSEMPDNEYYALNEEFMAACEARLQAWS